MAKETMQPPKKSETKRTILIVEDDELLRGVLRDELESEGFTVLDAKDGKMGLEMATSGVVDLILLDVVMPNMNGMKMLQKLREYETGDQIPVILLTNLNDPEKVAEATIERNVVDYLVKSDWSLKDVSKKVKATLGLTT